MDYDVKEVTLFVITSCIFYNLIIVQQVEELTTLINEVVTEAPSIIDDESTTESNYPATICPNGSFTDSTVYTGGFLTGTTIFSDLFIIDTQLGLYS